MTFNKYIIQIKTITFIFLLTISLALQAKHACYTQRGKEENGQAFVELIQPIGDAITANDVKTVEKILEEGFGINERCVVWVPLDYAISTNNLKMADFLLKRGALLSETHIGIGTMKPEIARFLLDRGLPTDLWQHGHSSGDFDSNGMIVAASRNNTDIIQILLDAGVNPNQQNNMGMTALMYATQDLHVETVRILLAHSANKHLKNKDGKTALQLVGEKANNSYWTSKMYYLVARLMAGFTSTEMTANGAKKLKKMKEENQAKEKEIKELLQKN